MIFRGLFTLILIAVGAVLFRLLFIKPRRGDYEEEEKTSLPLVSENETFVEVFNSTDTALLDILSADLTAAGIPNMVVGREANALYTHLPAVSGSIQTPERFVKAARAIIDEVEQG